MTIAAQFRDQSGYEFEQMYKTRGALSSSIKRTKKATFVHAVDYQEMLVIKPHNLQEYLNAKTA